MSAVMQSVTTHDAYLAGLLPGSTAHVTDPAWLNTLRADATQRVHALPFPSTRDEEWRFSDFSLMCKTAFTPAVAASALTLTDIEPFLLPEAANSRLVFINGIYAAHLSSAALPTGVVATNFSATLTNQTLRTQLARHANFQHEAFVALNTSHLQEGALIILNKNTTCATPLHLLFISTASTPPVASHPRCLVVAESGSACTFIEDYVCLAATNPSPTYFTNAVTEIVIADDATVLHTRLQRESVAAFHVGYAAVRLGRNSCYDSNSIAFGARLSRHNLHIIQSTEGAHCTLNGLALISGRQVADTHTVMDHTQPNGNSAQLHKCIADGGAHAIFNGKIFVRKEAQHTNSTQSSRNLLLSNKGRIDTKPQLEIFADDVKCAHGATVSQLETEEMFYLNSRGLNANTARNLLIYAFAEEIIDKVPVASLRQCLSQMVSRQMGEIV